jgi:hypothetical protein
MEMVFGDKKLKMCF